MRQNLHIQEPEKVWNVFKTVLDFTPELGDAYIQMMRLAHHFPPGEKEKRLEEVKQLFIESPPTRGFEYRKIFGFNDNPKMYDLNRLLQAVQNEANIPQPLTRPSCSLESTVTPLSSAFSPKRGELSAGSLPFSPKASTLSTQAAEFVPGRFVGAEFLPGAPNPQWRA